MAIRSSVMNFFLISIQTGMPRPLGGDQTDGSADDAWTTVIIKQRVETPVWLGGTNLAGDGQADLVSHGGRDKAVCAYPAAHYPYWQNELALPKLDHGAFGENFTVGGMTEETVCVGDVYDIGEARVQISQPRQPCWKLARRWRVRDFPARVVATGYTGWYFRVLREGYVAAGASIALVERHFTECTIKRANEIMYGERDNPGAARALAACALLSESWRAALLRRAAG